ncbi:MAG: arginase family protein [Streptomycetaceae bacterium]|nr:arginase family protein [Streptomycetaceae bacterium]
MPLAAGARASAALLRTGLPVFLDADAPEAADIAPTALVRNAAAVRDALADVGDRVTLTLGGDCGVDLEPIASAAARYGGDLAVVWLDAHGDLNTPAESPSGAFHGMVLRTLLGDGPDELLPPAEGRLTPAQVLLAGTRALDAGEQAYLDHAGMTPLQVAALADPKAIVARLASLGASRVYVHIDLDVLDPGEFAGLSYPEPHGVPAAHLCAAVAALTGHYDLVGLSLTEHAPTPDAAENRADAEVLRGLITAAGLGGLLR